jgi:hypothetical protein
MLLMQAKSITWARGGGRVPEISTISGPNDTQLTARCHFTGPKKVLISRPNPFPLALVVVMDQKHYIRGPTYNHRSINSYYALLTCRDKEEKKKAILEQHVNMTQKQEEMRVIDGKKVP